MAQSNHTMIQFRLTNEQMAELRQYAPDGMSKNQAAKWLVLLEIDRPSAHSMTTNLKHGRKRLTGG